MFSVVSSHLSNLSTWTNLSLIDKEIPFYWNEDSLNLFEYYEFNITLTKHINEYVEAEYLVNYGEYKEIKLITDPFFRLTFIYKNKNEIEWGFYPFPEKKFIKKEFLHDTNSVKMIQYDETGKKHYESNAMNDKLHGLEILYYEDGSEQIRQKTSYTHGVKGPVEIYYGKNGNVESIIENFIEEEFTKAIYYDKNGQIISEVIRNYED